MDGGQHAPIELNHRWPAFVLFDVPLQDPALPSSSDATSADPPKTKKELEDELAHLVSCLKVYLRGI